MKNIADSGLSGSRFLDLIKHVPGCLRSQIFFIHEHFFFLVLEWSLPLSLHLCPGRFFDVFFDTYCRMIQLPLQTFSFFERLFHFSPWYWQKDSICQRISGTLFFEIKSSENGLQICKIDDKYPWIFWAIVDYISDETF